MFSLICFAELTLFFFNLEDQLLQTQQKQPVIYLRRMSRMTVKQQLILKKQRFIWINQQYI